MLDWVAQIEKRPRRTFLVHGEEEAALAFAETLKAEAGLEQVDVPEMHQQFTV